MGESFEYWLSVFPGHETLIRGVFRSRAATRFVYHPSDEYHAGEVELSDLEVCCNDTWHPVPDWVLSSLPRDIYLDLANSVAESPAAGFRSTPGRPPGLSPKPPAASKRRSTPTSKNKTAGA